MEGSDSEFVNFTLPASKAFLEPRSHNVSGNKQEIVARAIGCPKTLFSFLFFVLFVFVLFCFLFFYELAIF